MDDQETTSTKYDQPGEDWYVDAGRFVVDSKNRVIVVGHSRKRLSPEGGIKAQFESEGGISPQEADRLIHRIAGVPEMERTITALLGGLNDLDDGLYQLASIQGSGVTVPDLRSRIKSLTELIEKSSQKERWKK